MTTPESIRVLLIASASRVSSVLPALLLPNVLLLSIPLELYLPNRQEIEPDIVPCIAALATVGAVAALACVLATPARYRSRVVSTLFFAGVYFLLADAFAPTTLAVQDGQFSDQAIPEPLAFTLIELSLVALTIVAAWWIRPAQIRMFGSLLVLGFFASNVVELQLARFDDAAEGGGAFEQDALLVQEPAGRPNVYHFVFDGFSADGFGRLVDQVGAREELAGFTWFRRNLTNHTSTNFSFPSFLSGKLIEQSGFNSWRNDVMAGKAGLFQDARRHGYTVSTYGNCQFVPGPGSCTAPRKIESPLQRAQRLLHFFDLVALRWAPNFLQDESYSSDGGLFTRVGVAFVPGIAAQTAETRGKKLVLRLIEQVIHDEATRPATDQYVFGHFLIPHLPFTLDRECAYRGSGKVPYVGGEELLSKYYFAQAECALRQILELVAHLKEQGRFEESAIVIHADHGNLTRCIDSSGVIMSDATSAMIARASKNGRDGETIDCLSRALLLVKQPGTAAVGELAVSDRRTQLLDLRAAIVAMAGIEPVETEGVDIFAEPFPKRRERSLIAGSYQEDARQIVTPGQPPKFVHVCQQTSSGELNHFVRVPGVGWSVEPDVLVNCL